MGLSKTEIASFHRDGFLFPIAVNNCEEAATVRRQWDRLEAIERLNSSDRDLLYNRHRDQQFIWDIVTKPAILDALEPLLGPNILLFGTRVICKWANDDSVVAWHQDVSERNRLTPPVQITAWYAIDSSDEDNGCVCCVPASHKMGMLRREPAAVLGNLLRLNEQSQVPNEMAAAAVPVRLAAGQVSLHHGFTLHCSGRNVSGRRRCGLVIRYVPAEVRQGDDVAFNQRDTAIVVRGVDEFNGTEAESAMATMSLALAARAATGAPPVT